MTRIVDVYEWQKEDGKPYERVHIGLGAFREYGCDYEELEHGVGNYSTAIVEMADGKVKNIPVDLIRFTESTL